MFFSASFYGRVALFVYSVLIGAIAVIGGVIYGIVRLLT